MRYQLCVRVCVFRCHRKHPCPSHQLKWWWFTIYWNGLLSQGSVGQYHDKNGQSSSRQIMGWWWSFYLQKTAYRASLVAQWLRIHLLMQGTQVRALVREDPPCRGATKPVRHNYWACALGPVSHNYWAHEPQLLSPRAITTEVCAPRAHAPQQERPL